MFKFKMMFAVNFTRSRSFFFTDIYTCFILPAFQLCNILLQKFDKAEGIVL